ncbi:MAG: alanine--tRNA ligase, partial [Ureaplasma sp.]|nr:alanine--tRNA ligase [Ureaplasma sp.]
NKDSIIKIIDSIINTMQPFYSYLLNEKSNIHNVILHEYEIFNITLSQGLKIINNAINNNSLNNETVFNLVTTYGFPIESIKEIANENGLEIDEEEFKKRFAIHQKISQSNKQEIAMDSQNNSLISLSIQSKFHYDKNEIDAKVIKLYDDQFNEVNELNNQNGYVIFDNTVFYATSGGQIHDTGLINNKYFVDNVIKAPGFQHVHHVNYANLKIDEIVHLSINKEDRKINMAHHTSEHLLQAALINNINKNIKQLGAFKSPEKFTFDFQNPTKLSDEELTKIVDWVNNVIKLNIPVKVLMMSLEDAKKAGALGHFEDVYKKIQGLLRVIQIGDLSIELCGGTHVNNTSDIEQFAIISHYSRRAGEWRIEAISTNKNIQKYLNEYNDKLFEIYQNELN